MIHLRMRSMDRTIKTKLSPDPAGIQECTSPGIFIHIS